MEPKEVAAAARELLMGYDPASPGEMADALRHLWLRAMPSSPPALTPGQKQFVRDWGIPATGFEAAGAPVPVLTAVGSEIGKLARRRVDDFLLLAQLLWDRYGREGRVVAVVALGPMELAKPDVVVPVLHALAQTCVFWEDCDQLAMKAVEPIVRREPDTWLEPLGAWVTEENKWVRRCALVTIGRLPLAQPAWTPRCLEVAAPALGDPDLDVKRALSFALRLCARGDVVPVKQFILDRQHVKDFHSLWVLCDVVRSMTRPLLPDFTDLLPVYRDWLETAEPRARRSIEGAVRTLEGVPES